MKHKHTDTNRGRRRIDVPEEVKLVNAHYTAICVELGVCTMCHSRLTPKLGRRRLRYCDFCHELFGVGKRERGETE